MTVLEAEDGRLPGQHPVSPAPSNFFTTADEPWSSAALDAADSNTIGHDSLVTVRLSEPPVPLSVNTDIPPARTPTRHTLYSDVRSPAQAGTLESPKEESEGTPTPMAAFQGNADNEDNSDNEGKSDKKEQSERTSTGFQVGSVTPESSSDVEEDRDDDEEVDWEVLEKTEEMQPKAEHSEKVCATSGCWHAQVRMLTLCACSQRCCY
jgi:hypothetical protein